MSNLLRRNRLLIKYSILTIILLGFMIWLSIMNVFAGVQEPVNAFMDRMAAWGLPGMFILGLVSNVTLVLMIPYNLPFFALVLYADTLELIALGTVTGIGAGIGSTISYAVARTLVSRVHNLSDSELFRWTQRTIEEHPYTIPIFLFVVLGVPLPDFLVIVPLAMIHYPWQKMLIPMIIGKIFQNVVVAFMFRYAADLASRYVARNINFDVTAGLGLIFILVIAYQLERAQQNKLEAQAKAQKEVAVIN